MDDGYEKMHQITKNEVSPRLIAILPGAKKLEDKKAQFERLEKISVHFRCFKKTQLVLSTLET
jgi:hypothetical protein